MGLYFYSRPCGRGDRRRTQGKPEKAISTHAPAGGATGELYMALDLGNISTHAPAGGATYVVLYQMLCLKFLLTPLREGRRQKKKSKALHTPISTHAPAGGATDAEHKRDTAAVYFYSRPCGRGDQIDVSLTFDGADFYSRPCGRGDPTAGRRQPVYEDFYSRPCGRGDVEAPIIGHMNAIFLLTPLREGRQQFSTSPS